MKRRDKTLVDRMREARRLYDMRDLLGLDNKRRVIVCPLPMHPHQHNTPSFSIAVANDGTQRFKCHGSCGKQGDVVDLVGYMHIPGYNDKNLEHLERALSLLETGQRPSVPKKIRQAPAIEVNAWETFCPPGVEVVEYARTRGLTPETLKKFAIGQSGMYNKTWMTMPCFHFGKLMGIKMRNLHSTSLRDRFKSLSGSQNGLFNMNAVYLTQKPLLILKAEIPVMLLDQYGFTACSPTGGESSINQELYFAMVWAPKRVLVGDNDPNPAVRVKMVAAAQKRAEMYHAELKFPPSEYKDIDDWVLAEPEAAIPTIKGWLR